MPYIVQLLRLDSQVNFVFVAMLCNAKNAPILFLARLSRQKKTEIISCPPGSLINQGQMYTSHFHTI